LSGCIARGLQAVAAEQTTVREQVQEVHAIAATLDPGCGDSAMRQQQFERLQERLAASDDPLRRQMAVVMATFLVGLFAGGDTPELPPDNLALERWFRLPKGHERRIHGHKHAGVRIVQEGATLVLVLDAHLEHPGVFSAEDLVRYREAEAPQHEQEALQRRKVMRKARCQKTRCRLLAELEERYLNAS
jgi:hypothetical protein